MLRSVVDTRGLPRALRDRQWKRATAEFLVPLEITPGEQPVTGRIAGAQIGDINLCHLVSSAHFGTRTADLAGGLGGDRYKIAIATHGTVTVRQHGRTARLRPGQWTVYDTGSEYQVGAAHAFGLFIALVPREMLAERTQVASLAAVSFDSHAAATALLDAARTGAALDPALETIAQVVNDPTRAFRRHAESDEAIFLEATSIIRSQLPDEHLGPAYLAAVLGVSRRRLYDIFGQRVGPIARFIREQRLALARELLSRSAGGSAIAAGSNPATVDLSVGEIAALVGFADPAHFSRLFRARFGYPPSHLRSRPRPRPR